MTMPASPSVLTALLCLGCSSVFSMRKRAATSWLDNLPSRAQMAGRHSSNWSGATCYWNNATEQCLALALARPRNAPRSMCEPTTLQFPSGSESYPQNLSESQCKARVNWQGLACEWNATHHLPCAEPECNLIGNQGRCEWSPLACMWVKHGPNPYCTPMQCSVHDTKVDCTIASLQILEATGEHDYCHWNGWGCTNRQCSQAKHPMMCANFSSREGRRRSSRQPNNYGLGDRCWWEWKSRQCRASTSCRSYFGQSACNEDRAKWGTCEWNAKTGRCLHMASCDDYDTKSACTADAFGVGEKTFPGAACGWKLGSNLTVGPAHRIDSDNQVETSQILRIDSDHMLSSVQYFHDYDYSNHWDEVELLLKDLGLWPRWKARPTPVERVLDASGKMMSWSDIPTPIPDGFQLIFASCEDNLPPRYESHAGELLTACNHHSRATCDTATDVR